MDASGNLYIADTLNHRIRKSQRPTESFQPWLEVESKATPDTVADLRERGFGDNGTESTRPRQSGQRDDQMNEYDSAHPGNGINTSKNHRTQANLAIRIDSVILAEAA